LEGGRVSEREREQSTDNKASEILRRRGARTTKLQKAIDRGSPRFRAEEATEDGPSVPADMAGASRGRPAKPIRITVDLDAAQHRFLREYCLNTGTKGTEVLRGLLSELAEDEELRSRLTQRLTR
jgi:hypothetical protein